MRIDLFPADIYLAGLGMYDLRQVTLETMEALRSANAIYHLSDRHRELCDINPNTHDLSEVYLQPGKRRAEIYDNLASYVVDAASKQASIVLALDGNPMFFSDISWKTVAVARQRGLRVEVLPGVSSIDVLPGQLGFDPGDLGLQIFEATQLVLYQMPINAYSSSLVLQVGYFFQHVTTVPPTRQQGAYDRLTKHLQRFFPDDHPAIFIHSAYSREARTVVFSTSVVSIDDCRNEIKPGMTLYLPRIGVPAISPEWKREIGLEL